MSEAPWPAQSRVGYLDSQPVHSSLCLGGSAPLLSLAPGSRPVLEPDSRLEVPWGPPEIPSVARGQGRRAPSFPGAQAFQAREEEEGAECERLPTVGARLRAWPVATCPLACGRAAPENICIRAPAGNRRHAPRGWFESVTGVCLHRCGQSIGTHGGCADPKAGSGLATMTWPDAQREELISQQTKLCGEGLGQGSRSGPVGR